MARVFVTGSADGLGKMAAELLIEQGHTVVLHARSAAPGTGTPQIRVKHLASGSKLTDVSFDLHKGEVLGVVALEGQGQDELFDVLAGARKATGGAIEVKRVKAKGCNAITFLDNPSRRDLPSIHSDYWEPFWRVCNDEEVVICCHIGSGNAAPHPSMESPI